MGETNSPSVAHVSYDISPRDMKLCLLSEVIFLKGKALMEYDFFGYFTREKYDF
jgi:hypothetical protein